jgi:hypothetical protein
MAYLRSRPMVKRRTFFWLPQPVGLRSRRITKGAVAIMARAYWTHGQGEGRQTVQPCPSFLRCVRQGLPAEASTAAHLRLPGLPSTNQDGLATRLAENQPREAERLHNDHSATLARPQASQPCPRDGTQASRAIRLRARGLQRRRPVGDAVTRLFGLRRASGPTRLEPRHPTDRWWGGSARQYRADPLASLSHTA